MANDWETKVSQSTRDVCYTLAECIDKTLRTRGNDTWCAHIFLQCIRQDSERNHGDTLGNKGFSIHSRRLIYTSGCTFDNYTEIRILSAGTNSQIIGKSLNELNLSKSTKIIAIISSSGNISHNFSDTINPLDKILLQVSINN